MVTFRKDIHLGRRVPIRPEDENECMLVSISENGLAVDKYGRKWRFLPWGDIGGVYYGWGLTWQDFRDVYRDNPTSLIEDNTRHLSTSDNNINEAFELQRFSAQHYEIFWIAYSGEIPTVVLNQSPLDFIIPDDNNEWETTQGKTAELTRFTWGNRTFKLTCIRGISGRFVLKSITF